MKAIVLSGFRDKLKNKNYIRGQKIDITKERFEEINSTAFGVLVKAIKK